MSGQKMFRRKYILAKDTPKLRAGTVVHFDPFRGDYADNLFEQVKERFTLREVENSEWFTPASDLVPFWPPMIPPEKITTQDYSSSACVVVRVESQHNDMCDFCRNARDAIADTEAEVLKLARQILKRNYEAGSLRSRAGAFPVEIDHDLIRDPNTGLPRLVRRMRHAESREESK